MRGTTATRFPHVLCYQCASATTRDRASDSATDALRLTERIRRRDYGHMDIQITFDDPKAYTKPWTAELHPELIPDTDLLEFVCNENERDVPHLVGK